MRKSQVVQKRAGDQPINLGELQVNWLATGRGLLAAEKRLKAAQEVRDASKELHEKASAALRDGSRAVLG